MVQFTIRSKLGKSPLPKREEAKSIRQPLGDHCKVQEDFFHSPYSSHSPITRRYTKASRNWKHRSSHAQRRSSLIRSTGDSECNHKPKPVTRISFRVRGIRGIMRLEGCTTPRTQARPAMYARACKLFPIRTIPWEQVVSAGSSGARRDARDDSAGSSDNGDNVAIISQEGAIISADAVTHRRRFFHRHRQIDTFHDARTTTASRFHGGKGAAEIGVKNQRRLSLIVARLLSLRR